MRVSARASDVTIAMELGADGVLLQHRHRPRQGPVKMAVAMKHALEAGRLSYQAGESQRSATPRPAALRGRDQLHPGGIGAPQRRKASFASIPAESDI
jgi:thiazole synthase ThiGH ThiG subunit